MEESRAGCTECCGSCFDDLLKEILPEHQLAMLRTLEKLWRSLAGA
jgi:bacterioferritin-associated ferredoxin